MSEETTTPAPQPEKKKTVPKSLAHPGPKPGAKKKPPNPRGLGHSGAPKEKKTEDA